MRRSGTAENGPSPTHGAVFGGADAVGNLIGALALLRRRWTTQGARRGRVVQELFEKMSRARLPSRLCEWLAIYKGQGRVNHLILHGFSGLVIATKAERHYA
jgi:hypothetical protein